MSATIIERMMSVANVYYYKQKKHKPSEKQIVLPVPAYRQTHSYTCAYIAGLMALHFFGINKDRKFLETLNPDPDNGVCLGRMIRGLRMARLKTKIVKNISFGRICVEIANGNPIITTVEKDEHWIIIVGFGNKKVLTNGDDVRIYSWKAFKKEWGHKEVICLSK